MGASPSQHLVMSPNGVQWPLQDDLGIVIALPQPGPEMNTVRKIAQEKRPIWEMVGKRVLTVQSESPTAAAGLVPWLDYIVGVDGKFFTGEEASAFKNLEAGKKVKLHVYNAKVDTIRECTVSPVLTAENSVSLGLKISNWQTPDTKCLDNVIRVMGVAWKSPAADCSLEPEIDYLLGSSDYGAFRSLDDLEHAVTDRVDRILEIYVYNSVRDDVRVVQLHPNWGWSEDGGLVGAELACGILHRVPQSCRRTIGKDRSTAAEQAKTITKNDIVRTPEGLGELLEKRRDGSCIVKLDWGLENGVQVIAQFSSKNVDVIG